jgi:hypothetical protein
MFTPGYHGNGLQKSSKKVVLLYDFNVKILYRANRPMVCIMDMRGT